MTVQTAAATPKERAMIICKLPFKATGILPVGKVEGGEDVKKVTVIVAGGIATQDLKPVEDTVGAQLEQTGPEQTAGGAEPAVPGQIAVMRKQPQGRSRQ